MRGPGRGTGRAWLERAAVFLAAGLYFAASWDLNLEWMDQGQIVYPAWLVAEGAIPFRDFPHAYGPAVFLLLGGLFRTFGADLLAVRVALIVLKALIAVLAFEWSRRIMSPAMAVGVLALNVVVLGTPWWLFNTPYPNHFALALTLAGFLVLLGGRRRRRAALAAGLCFGLATTFKQTSGAFACLALLWWALHERQGGGARAGEPEPDRAAVGWRALRQLALAASLGVFVLYVTKDPHLWNGLVLLAPVAATVLALALREQSSPPTAADHRLALATVIGAAAGFALPIVACAAFYTAISALDRLIFSVLTVPAAMQWFVPFPFPTLRTLLLAGAVLGVLAGARARGRRATVAAWTGGLGLLALFIWRVQAGEGLVAFVRGGTWVGDAFSLVFVLPLAVIAVLVIDLYRVRPPFQQSAATAPEEAAALYFYAVAALQHLYPAADFWHVVNMLPVYTVLLGYVLDRPRRPAAHGRAARVGVVAFATVVLFMLPFAWTLVEARVGRSAATTTVPRATGIFDPSPKFRAAADLIAFLARPEQRDRALAVVANEQMIYFLAGKRSVWNGDEFLLYLVEAGLLAPPAARAMLDEDTLLRALDERRPLIVDYGDGAMSGRLWAAFPALKERLDARYTPRARFERYVVLDAATAEPSRNGQ